VRWFYLSFADDEGFRGACVVEALDELDAVLVAHEHGINPGGEVMLLPTPGNVPGPLPTYRLLSRAELGEGKTLGELQDAGFVPPEDARFVD
jgi:hypothetical protein